MARKAKKRMHKMPPLSVADKLIYWGIFLLLVGMWLLLLFGPLYLRDQIAFADETVLAAEAHGSIYWLMVPWMTVFLMTFILWNQHYQDRRPIFGLKNFKYGPPAWPKVYPLFMKNKPYVWVSERKKKERKQIAAVLLAVLLISFIPFPWGLYGRDCLLHDGGIVEYSMLNRKTGAVSSGEIKEIEIGTFRYSTGGRYSRTTRWGVRMVFHTDSGEKFIFESRDFRTDVDSEILYWLDAMLALKGRYNPAIIRYDGLDNLNRVISDRNLNQAETEILYRLFGME